MVKCKDISKGFGTQAVLEAFSYKFEDKGFYLLLGESGSGKTTLLNIMSGFLDFDSGEIEIWGNSFNERVDRSVIKEDFDYITQDPFFVEFLTVFDNLRMIRDDNERIMSVLKRFGLEEKVEQYPTTLSGGEKQRLAIARSLLEEKKILFLDEPTASLDGENKMAIFKLLSEIKEDVLIICASHDPEAQEFADKVIQFKKIHKACEIKKTDIVRKEKQKAVSHKYKNNANKKPVTYFMKKWFKSKRRNRKSGILFGAFLTVAICICALADTPQHKKDSHFEYKYKINMCKLCTHDNDVYDELWEIDGIKDVVIEYGRNVPDAPSNPDGTLQESADYQWDCRVLPFSSETFKFSDSIKYGTYFTEANQVILMYDLAESLMPDNPEKLIGQTVKKNFYGIGEVELEIVGIFDNLDDIENVYFWAASTPNDISYFVNSELMRQLYANNNLLDQKTNKHYRLYFDSYRDMKGFFDANSEDADFIETMGNLGSDANMGDRSDVFYTMYRLFLPLSVCIAFFTILFYVNLIKTEMTYNNQFMSVFNYAGYSIRTIKGSFVWLTLLNLLKICLLSACLAFGITWFVNGLNEKYAYIDFQIFTYNIPILSTFIICIVLVSVVAMNVILRRLKFSSWYENIITQRDLI